MKDDDLNKVTTLQLTINTSGASGNGTVIVCGRIATLTASIHNNTTGTSLYLAGFNTNYAPRIDIRISVCAYSADGLMAECILTTAGNLVFNIPSGYAKDMKLSGSWIVAG